MFLAVSTYTTLGRGTLPHTETTVSITVTGLPLMYSMWNLPCFFSPSPVSSGQPSARAWRGAAPAVTMAATNNGKPSLFMAVLRDGDYGLPPRLAPPLGFLAGAAGDAGLVAG